MKTSNMSLKKISMIAGASLAACGLFGTPVQADPTAPTAGTAGQAQTASAPAATGISGKEGGSRLASPRLSAGLRKKEDALPLNGFYIGGMGIMNFAGQSDVDYETDLGDTMKFEGSGDVGGIRGGGGMKIGYNHFDKEKTLDEFQLVPTIELEAGYFNLQQDQEGEASGRATDIEVDFSVITVTANAYLKARNKYVTPYAGFGGGFGIIDMDEVSGRVAGDTTAGAVTTPGTDGVDDVDGDETSQVVPIVQGMFGLERDVYKQNLTVFLEYKALYIPDADFKLDLQTAGNDATLEFSNMLNHILQGGVRWNF
jgi:hypothetical protein